MSFANNKKTNQYKELKEKPHWQGTTVTPATKTTTRARDTKSQETSQGADMSDDLNRGRVAIFIDGLNLFHAALQIGIEIDYVKLLCRLTQTSRLLRAFFLYWI